MKKKGVELGCGLIGIGREWGVRKTAIPVKQEVFSFLDTALALGIRYYDTAPAYGESEARLGAWLHTLSSEKRGNIRVATKFGELWQGSGQTRVDHSYAGLRDSLEQSMDRLGKIDVLQLHKTNPEVLGSTELQKAWRYARELGITTIGASVSDVASAEIVCADGQYDLIQLPFNQTNTDFVPIIERATEQSIQVVINRPFAMGAVVGADHGKNPATIAQEAYGFILEHAFSGVVLTGTKSSVHLQENYAAFAAAQATA